MDKTFINKVKYLEKHKKQNPHHPSLDGFYVWMVKLTEVRL